MKFNKIFSVVSNVLAIFLVAYGLAGSIAAMNIKDTSSIEYLKLIITSQHSFIEAFAIIITEAVFYICRLLSRFVSIWNQLLTLSPDQSSSEEISKEESTEEKKD